MRAKPLSLGHRGVSVIVGEVIMIAIVMVAMAAIAWAVISGGGKQPRRAEFDVRLENASPPPTNSIKVILLHRGGDTLGIPRRDGDEFRVTGFQGGYENTWENRVPWDNWEFSSPSNGFEFGENAVGYLTHDNASIQIGDTVKIVVTDMYSQDAIYALLMAVEDSSLYV